jgi:predicted nucleic acid-binding protein
LIFVDSGAWFAAMVPWDANHTAAAVWLAKNSEPLLTTDFVIDETLTLLRIRGENPRALQFGKRVFEGKLAELHLISFDEITAAWNVFQKFGDKGWSFTDCTSKVVMESLQIDTAFSFDHHFRQFGMVSVVP